MRRWGVEGEGGPEPTCLLVTLQSPLLTTAWLAARSSLSGERLEVSTVQVNLEQQNSTDAGLPQCDNSETNNTELGQGPAGE